MLLIAFGENPTRAAEGRYGFYKLVWWHVELVQGSLGCCL